MGETGGLERIVSRCAERISSIETWVCTRVLLERVVVGLIQCEGVCTELISILIAGDYVQREERIDTAGKRGIFASKERIEVSWILSLRARTERVCIQKRVREGISRCLQEGIGLEGVQTGRGALGVRTKGLKI